MNVSVEAGQGQSCLPACGASMLAMAAAPGVASMTIILVAHVSEWAPGRNPFARSRDRRPVPAFIALAAANLLALR
jgi:hypothetical protein